MNATTPIEESNKHMLPRENEPQEKRQRRQRFSSTFIPGMLAAESQIPTSSSSSPIPAIFQKNTSCSSKPKLTSSEKLEKNRIAAIQHQKSQEPLYFQVSERREIPNIYLKFSELLDRIVTYCIESTSKEIDRHQVGIAYCQGMRNEMEDTHIAEELNFVNRGKKIRAQLYAVCDGHAQSFTVPESRKAADFVAEELPREITKHLHRLKDKELSDENIREALKKAVRITSLRFNQHYISIQHSLGTFDTHHQDGTTLIACLILNGKIWTMNVGDSRACIIYPSYIEQLSEDADANIKRYKNRIEKLGGFVKKEMVSGVYRAQGFLGMAKAIGDQWIISKFGFPVIDYSPKITSHLIESGGYLLLGCDGLFEVATTDEVGEAIAAMASRDSNVKHMAANLVYSATRISNTTDNVTVLVIKLPAVEEKELVWKEPEDAFYSLEEDEKLDHPHLDCQLESNTSNSDTDISDFEEEEWDLHNSHGDSSYSTIFVNRLIELKENITLMVYPTQPDGSCGFHAIVGTDKHGTYQCVDISTERENFGHWLKEKYLQQQLPNEIKNIIMEYAKNYSHAPGYFRQGTQAQYEKFAYGYDELSFAEQDTRIEEFVNDPVVMEAYIHNMKQLETYLLQDELFVVGQFYNKRVILFQPDWNPANPLPTCNDPSVYEEGFTLDENDVCIWYGNNHFERAELLKQ